MKTTPKQRGSNFERRIKKWLEERGWTVFRSAGSQSAADLIALRPGIIVLAVQCKASHKPVLKKEETAGLLALQKLGATTLIICRDKHSYAIKVYELRADSKIFETGRLHRNTDWEF
jgi:Holliday junction resolvase